MEELKYDFDTEIVSKAIVDLVNKYPKLEYDDYIAFNTLPDDKGKAIFPISGGVINIERESITGHVYQEVSYPFYVYFRTATSKESIKLMVKEWLDDLGRWLEKQVITYEGKDYVIKDYPLLEGNRKFKEFSRQTPASLDSVAENGSELWGIYINAIYTNEFDR